MRRLRGLAVWGAALTCAAMLTVGAGAAPAGTARDPGAEPEVGAAQETGVAEAAGPAGEADLSYHGSAVMAGGRVDVRLTPRNHGPADVADSTVRLRWSAPLAAGEQRLAAGCARTGRQEVVCRTGPLVADGVGEQIVMRVWLSGRPAEVTMALDTVWGGGAVDRNRSNDRQTVLVLDTGDAYFF
ncbi:hypothetical protein [Streptomyces sp. NBC_00199]|uniref:hypothetical protein n=1 Tax=Streptomyces sp. NBC_00199 TaxID=2975678 RepID=UPI00225386E0|nr:hypothetical protein [Streptomyces sp. NBC_00199]MCX5269328.1 hypothetical protein [Streptomyces sp. NBC_00199]